VSDHTNIETVRGPKTPIKDTSTIVRTPGGGLTRKRDKRLLGFVQSMTETLRLRVDRLRSIKSCSDMKAHTDKQKVFERQLGGSKNVQERDQYRSICSDVKAHTDKT
jgi:hypothetical protein